MGIIMRRFRYRLGAAGLALAGLATVLAFAVAPSAGAVTNTLTAKTMMTNRDDSSAHGGNWAMDNFTRGSQITFKCATTTPCYAYTGKVSDTGHFTTVAGQLSPGFGYLNGTTSDPTMAVALTGTMTGSQTYAFYSNTPVSGASASNVPKANAGDANSSGMWPELFFPGGTHFYVGGALSDSLGTGFFKYTYVAKAGSNSDCPNMTSQWSDSSPSSGANATDGNILAPNASGC
jgi:hypothetical protein